VLPSDFELVHASTFCLVYISLAINFKVDKSCLLGGFAILHELIPIPVGPVPEDRPIEWCVSPLASRTDDLILGFPEDPLAVGLSLESMHDEI
jgi:hypothetical protein